MDRFQVWSDVGNTVKIEKVTYYLYGPFKKYL